MTSESPLTEFDRRAGPHLELHTSATSDLQIDLFMLGGGGEGHTWGMYRQAMREIDSRRARLVGTLHSIASLRLDVRSKTMDATENSGSTDARKQIAAERCVLDLELLASKIDADEGRISVILRESERLFARARELLDKMGGMDALHTAEIATYAHPMTNSIAPDKRLTPARNVLAFNADGWAALPANGALGSLSVYYPGPGHTDDNITVAIRGTSVAFGGCLIKGSKAKSLGNLAEADLDHYEIAVANFSAAFPDASVIAMSHSGDEDRDAIERTLRLAKEL